MENSLYGTFMREICNDYPNMCESSCEEEVCPFEMVVGHQVEEAINQTTFVSKKKNKQWMTICGCRPIRTFDGIIQEREYLKDISHFQPCEYRCTYVLKYGKCHYREETKLKLKLKERRSKLDHWITTSKSKFRTSESLSK